MFSLLKSGLTVYSLVYKHLNLREKAAVAATSRAMFRWTVFSYAFDIQSQRLKMKNFLTRIKPFAGKSRTVSALIQNLTPLRKCSAQALFNWAVRHDQPKLALRILNDHPINPAAQGNHAIHWASRQGYPAIVERLLLDKRVDPTSDDYFAPIHAAKNGHTRVFDLLLKHRSIQPSFCENIMLLKAAQYGRVQVVNLILKDDRVFPAAHHNTALIAACANGHRGVIVLLLSDPRVQLSSVERKHLIKRAPNSDVRDALRNHPKKTRSKR